MTVSRAGLCKQSIGRRPILFCWNRRHNGYSFMVGLNTPYSGSLQRAIHLKSIKWHVFWEHTFLCIRLMDFWHWACIIIQVFHSTKALSYLGWPHKETQNQGLSEGFGHKTKWKQDLLFDPSWLRATTPGALEEGELCGHGGIVNRAVTSGKCNTILLTVLWGQWTDN